MESIKGFASSAETFLIRKGFSPAYFAQRLRTLLTPQERKAVRNAYARDQRLMAPAPWIPVTVFWVATLLCVFALVYAVREFSSGEPPASQLLLTFPAYIFYAWVSEGWRVRANYDIYQALQTRADDIRVATDAPQPGYRAVYYGLLDEPQRETARVFRADGFSGTYLDLVQTVCAIDGKDS